MPNVVLLSEIFPLNVRQIRFNPFDPLQQFQAQYGLLSESELINAFWDRLKIIVNKCIENDKILILRDHSPSNFMHKKSFNVFLIDIIKRQYDTVSLITVRHPIDSFLAMQKKNWTEGVQDNFDEYCKRYLDFISRYEKYPMYFYEDFVVHTDKELKKMCNTFGLEFNSEYKNTFFKIKLTGNSGRQSDEIILRPRNEMTKEFKRQVLQSKHFRTITKKLKYSLD